MSCPHVFAKAKAIALLVVLACFTAGALQAVAPPTLTVKGSDGATLTDYRWVLEEDNTYHGAPGVIDPDTLSLRFYTSHMPVVDKGDKAQPLPALVNGKHYFISVMPKAAGTYSIGGASFKGGDGAVTVVLNKLPLPTAQIAIFVFEDTRPINNIPDLPEEQGLGGFNVLIEDAGGRYGAAAGTQTKDAWDNPLGTTYVKCTDPKKQVCDPYGNYVWDYTANAPVIATDKSGKPVVQPMKTGPCPGDTCGMLFVKNLSPGKYGVSIVPPMGQGWQQTSTIEGTKIIDAWVKANEPPYFAEFGPVGWHTAFGFVKKTNLLTGGANAVTIRGRVVNNHLSRPPNYAFYNGAPFMHTNPWVGLNDQGGLPGVSRGLYADETADGDFSIANVTPGSYQLAVWDNNLDLIFASYQINVTAGPGGVTCNGVPAVGGVCDLAEVPVNNWFTATHHYVFIDANENGFWDPGETGLPDQVVNIRWRDGSINQTAPTDSTGFVPFDEVFPFFAWQVAEVDYTRGKPTGVTVAVDNGGPVGPPDWAPGLNTQPLESLSLLGPQPQNCTSLDILNADDTDCYGKAEGTPIINPHTGNNLLRTEAGPVLTQAFQGFMGQTSVFMWGKKPYDGTNNGGITGIVYYDTTRAEDDPKFNAPEVWQPGIPRVTVRLWTPLGVQIAETTTDSWDDSVPRGCKGDVFYAFPSVDGNGNPIPGTGTPKDCYDGLRNFNQVRPGVFDGGYAFTECYSDGTGKCKPLSAVANPLTDPTIPLPPGQYIVEVVPPRTPDGRLKYDIVKEEDKNVDFGDDYVPSPQLQSWPCVGDPAEFKNPVTGVPYYSATVPPFLDLFPGVPTAAAGAPRTLCNAKAVDLSNGANAAADFFLFTQVPVAGHIRGFILDDTANEFDPTSPNFGEKYAPPFMPVSIRDWTGREISRVYSDKFGMYNALVPSTYSANRPAPSGMAPNMLTTCMNARNLPGGGVDPWHQSQYSEFCYTFQYMPGVTTYLDTPVVPVGAFAGPNQQQLDCELPDKTPRIRQATVPANPYGGGPLVTAAGQQITITSMGTVLVDNPNYCPGPPINPVGACPKIDPVQRISRDYGFGTTPGTVTINGTPLTGVVWGNASITATVPAGVTTGQLVVTRGDNGRSTVAGLTVQVRVPSGATVRAVSPRPGCDNVTTPCPLQAAIDASKDGDIILAGPGRYEEMVIMWKPVILQGWGEGVTTIDAVKVPAEKLQAWRNKVQSLLDKNDITLLPGQEAGLGNPEPVLFFNEEGAGVFVVPKSGKFKAGLARIDGFAITGADTGGGIVVNGYANDLVISNNRITNNTGAYGGGIRVGHPLITNVAGTAFTDAMNDNVKIRNNMITHNGGLGGAGGGVSICTGADGYEVSGNWICGNFTTADGAGIGHLGVSTNGTISGNTIIFNENFVQTVGVNTSGGGVFVAGQPPLAGQTLSPGSGTVKILGNLIQGNLAGSGDGGGIRLASINGQDVADNRTRKDRWHRVDIMNNMIVNNVAGMAAGGISMADAANVNIIHNTIVNNESAAVAGTAFSPGLPNQSNPQPAGVVGYAHSTALRNAAAAALVGRFANPNLQDNIIFRNRSYFFQVDTAADPPQYKLVPAPVPYQDLAVVGTGVAADRLDPRYSILTNSAAGYHASNILRAPGATPDLFVQSYANQQAGTTVMQPEATTALTPPPAFDEGGNFIRVRYGPLSLSSCMAYGAGPNPACTNLVVSNYHLVATAGDAINRGLNLVLTFPDLATDFDRQPRPRPGDTCAGSGAGCADIGADELQ